MREILFRGKRIDNGEWVTGFYVHYDDTKDNHEDDCDYIVGIHTGKHFPFFEVIPETVGQYTGLTDKNGKKIFEGDIVERKRSDKTSYYQICYDEGIASFIGLRGIGFTRFVYDSERFEVIGNIYDNSELIEGCEQV